MLGKTDTVGINCRDGSVSTKAHTDGLCHTVHGIGGIHTGTGTTGRTDMLHIFINLLLGHEAGLIGTYCLKHRRKASLAAIHTACQHRTAAHEYCRNVDSCRSHQKARHIFVTVRNHDQCVKLMGFGHTLCGICDQFAGYQGIFHTDMSHGDTVTHSDGRKDDGGTTRHSHTKLYRFCDFIQIHMTRNDLIVGTNDSYQGFFHFFLCIS